MLFHSSIFIFIFLPASLIIFYYLLIYVGNQASIIFICLSSLVFYSAHTPHHIAIILSSIVVNYWFARRLHDGNVRPFLALAIAFNLMMLGWFKYLSLISETIQSTTGLEFGVPDIVLPIAISFFTFQQISYLVDVARNGAPLYPFIRYFAFVTFFPQLIAGPILHHSEIFPQFERRYLSRNRIHLNLALGGTLFCFGLIKKLGIADSIAPFADALFNASGNGYTPPMLDAWLGVGAYSLQIYFDFSGYSDMALGLARMFGFRLPLNFYSPYRATNIISFWRRWHMTLSRFLREYLYIPLGGNRRGYLRRYTNIFVVMVLGGLWHGAAWSFALWGALHGCYLIINHLWNSINKPKLNFPHLRFVAWAVTMLAVLIAWVPFRSDDLDTALAIYRGMFGFEGVRLGESRLLLLGKQNYLFGNPGLVLANLGLSIDSNGVISLTEHAWLTMAIFIAILMPNSFQLFSRYRPALYVPYGTEGETFPQFRLKLIWPLGLAVGVLASLAFFKQSTTVEFLYFQF